jgi:putative adhesin
MTKRLFPVLFLLTLTTASLPASTPLAPAQAQQQDDDDWCRRERGNNDREQYCEVRRFTVAAAGTMAVDASPNGGVDVRGEARADTLVLAKVSAQADSLPRAKQIADAVRVTAQSDRVSADGPSGLARREGWSVSYRLMVPTVSMLSLSSVNGGITVRDVDGEIEFKTVNGGVNLTNTAGNVRGRTSNGGINVDLDGPSWKGEGLNVETSNGGVNLRIPEHYSAHLEASTNNGGYSIDFPLRVQGRIDRDINADLGSGGAPIRVRTNNGGVRITRK